MLIVVFGNVPKPIAPTVTESEPAWPAVSVNDTVAVPGPTPVSVNVLPMVAGDTETTAALLVAGVN